jgi:hypothetical protein
VGKLPVGRARPRPSRVLEPLVVREELRIISRMRRPACPLLVAVYKRFISLLKKLHVLMRTER